MPETPETEVLVVEPQQGELSGTNFHALVYSLLDAAGIQMPNAIRIQSWNPESPYTVESDKETIATIKAGLEQIGVRILEQSREGFLAPLSDEIQ